jgi:hypothetical protein
MLSMENDKVFELPKLITMNEYGGNFTTYFEAVYSIFYNDFVKHKPVYRGRRLGLKKHPISQNKEATFWHMTSEGEDEQNRTPDLRRLERISWPAPIINGSEDSYLKVWSNQRKEQISILIWHEAESYLVVLRDRGEYILPWTTYHVTNPKRKSKLMAEYEAYKKAETAQL